MCSGPGNTLKLNNSLLCHALMRLTTRGRCLWAQGYECVLGDPEGVVALAQLAWELLRPIRLGCAAKRRD